MANQLQFFEIVPAPEGRPEDVYRAGDGTEAIWFRKVEVSGAARTALEAELETWALVSRYEWVYENLAYNDRRSGKGERVIPFSDLVFGGSRASNQVRGGCLLDGGVFAGVTVRLENTSSYGMAVTKSEGFGALLTDGRKIGRTGYSYSHCSTEIDDSHSAEYFLRRKTEG